MSLLYFWSIFQEKQPLIPNAKLHKHTGAKNQHTLHRQHHFSSEKQQEAKITKIMVTLLHTAVDVTYSSII